jgi:hypothetical protein
VPSPSVVYKTDIQKEATFVWVIVPGRGTIPHVVTELLSVDDLGATVRIDTLTVHIPTQNGKARVE